MADVSLNEVLYTRTPSFGLWRARNGANSSYGRLLRSKRLNDRASNDVISRTIMFNFLVRFVFLYANRHKDIGFGSLKLLALQTAKVYRRTRRVETRRLRSLLLLRMIFYNIEEL